MLGSLADGVPVSGGALIPPSQVPQILPYQKTGKQIKRIVNSSLASVAVDVSSFLSRSVNSENWFVHFVSRRNWWHERIGKGHAKKLHTDNQRFIKY